MFGGLFRRDPTRGFKRTIVMPLTWDMRDGALNGIVPGDGLETLAPLGPASHHSSSGKGHHILEYADLGIIVIMSEGRTETMTFPVSQVEDHSRDPRFKTAAVKISPVGPVLSPSIREADIESYFGPPTERESDDVDGVITTMTETGKLTYEFEFTRDGALLTFTVFET